MMHKHLFSIMLLGIFCVFVPSSAYAQLTCNLEGSGLTTVVVTCVEGVITNATILLLTAVSNLQVMTDWLVGLLVLYTLFFGLRVVTGETELTKKGWEWLIKMGLVILFANNLGGFAPGILAAMAGLQDIVTNSLSITTTCAGTAEFGASGVAIPATGSGRVWGHIDCLLIRVFGIGADGGALEANAFAFASAIMGVIAAALFSGTMGIMVFTLGIMALTAIFSLAYRAVLGYLLSYALVSIMIIISPLIVPLILFTTTANVFDAWRRAILGAVFLPAFITAYLFIAIPLIDYAIFSATNSVGEVIPSFDTVIEREELDEGQRNEAPKCGQSTAEITLSDQLNQQTAGDEAAADERENELTPFLSLASNICKLFPFASLDLGEMHDHKMMRIALSLLTLFIISWMVKKMLESIVSLATYLMRGGHAINSVMSGGGTFGRYVARATGGTGI